MANINHSKLREKKTNVQVEQAPSEILPDPVESHILILHFSFILLYSAGISLGMFPVILYKMPTGMYNSFSFCGYKHSIYFT